MEKNNSKCSLKSETSSYLSQSSDSFDTCDVTYYGSLDDYCVIKSINRDKMERISRTPPASWECRHNEIFYKKKRIKWAKKKSTDTLETKTNKKVDKKHEYDNDSKDDDSKDDDSKDGDSKSSDDKTAIKSEDSPKMIFQMDL